MNPILTKIAEKNIRNAFEMLIGDYLVNGGDGPKDAEQFASELVKLAERSCHLAMRNALKSMEQSARKEQIEKSIRNPKISK